MRKTLSIKAANYAISEITGMWQCRETRVCCGIWQSMDAKYCRRCNRNFAGAWDESVIQPAVPLPFLTSPEACWLLMEKALIKFTVKIQHDHPGVEIVDLYDSIDGSWAGHGVGPTFKEALCRAYLEAHNFRLEED